MQTITYCLSCKKDTKNIGTKVVRTKNNRLAMMSKCAICGKNKFRFIKEQEARGLLSNLGIKTPLSKVPLLNLLFIVLIYKMNEIINKFLLVGDKFWGVDLADMQLLSRQNKGIKYLLCAIDLFSKYAFVVPLKDKLGASIVKWFEKIVNDSNRRPNKIWVDQGSEFYNKVF